FVHLASYARWTREHPQIAPFMYMRSCLFIMLAAVLAFASCEEGNPLDNTAPDTRIFLDGIQLTGQARLNSVVKLHWSGEDIDGYITGYELSFNNTDWSLVTTQDSTFRFPINPGSDSTDVDFWVRAIDNDGNVDPSPAYLNIPIKNAPPVAKIDTVKLIPDTVYSVFSGFWNVTDLDGQETLDSVFVKINNGDWFPLAATVSFITIVPENPGQVGTQGARIFVGSNPEAERNTLEGLVVEGENRLMLRGRDIAGTFSLIDTSKSFYIKAQNSDMLVIDDHTAAGPDNVLLPALSAVYPGYDYFELTSNIPPFWDPTFGKYLGLYDKVVWYSDGAENNAFGNQLFLEIAANQLQLYLNQGGKLLISTPLPGGINTPERNGVSAIFGFSPMDSVSSSRGQARMSIDSLLTPSPNFSLFPELKNENFIIGLDPFYAKDPSNILYTAGLTRASGWTGPSTIAGITLGSTGRTNQVFFSVELHNFNKEPANLNAMLDQVLNQEFDW
ncbi:MAG: hypothetical protein AB8F95_00035, partial [Bacteroidia bacterium]